MFNREEHIANLDSFINFRIGIFDGSYEDKCSLPKEASLFMAEAQEFTSDACEEVAEECKERLPEPQPDAVPPLVPPVMPQPSASSSSSARRFAMPQAMPSKKSASNEMGTPVKRVETTKKEPITSAISSFLKEKFEDSAVAKKLNYYMHAKDITTSMIYERCYVDRKLISKITNRSNYHPSKATMLALCIGLQLNINEATEFIALAGYSFTNTSKFDLVIEYMLTNEIYDLRFINEMLEKYEQPLLGA
ncbi:MAG: hypothetical protein MJ166_08745 [Clostridia bacterium]|nr:hypothetical protein [Clostridia bacterium]